MSEETGGGLLTATTIQQCVSAVSARKRKSRSQKLQDNLSGYFIPGRSRTEHPTYKH